MNVIDLVLNGRFLGRPISGVERYAREMVGALDAALVEEPEFRVQLLAPKGVECDLDLERIQFRQEGGFSGHMWEQFTLLRAARNCTLVNLANSGPIGHTRQLTIIHDAAVFRFPRAYTWRYGTLHRFLGRMLALRSNIGTVSQFSQGELAEFLCIDRSSIDIFSNGSEHLAAGPIESTIYDHFELGAKPYLLVLGTANPNKNFAITLKAWEMSGLASSARLVVVGSGVGQAFKARAQLSSNTGVIEVGRVSDAELRGLYQHASAFIFASLYEGFGIPPLEALVNGCPVIASDIPPLHEVCGAAAEYFDPNDACHLAQLMTGRIHEASRFTDGKLQLLERFSWRKSAILLLGAIKKINEYDRR